MIDVLLQLSKEPHNKRLSDWIDVARFRLPLELPAMMAYPLQLRKFRKATENFIVNIIVRVMTGFSPKVMRSLKFESPTSIRSAEDQGVGMLTDLIRFLAMVLVEYPDKIRVSEFEGKQASMIELKVAKQDLPKVIGRNGANANAMRVILKSVAARMNRRAFLEIIE